MPQSRALPSAHRSQPPQPRFGLSFGALCGFLTAWAVALRVLLVPVPPHDFWWHMAQGRAISELGRVPIADSFSWTRGGAPFFDQSWLAQWIFFQVHALGGIQLLIVVQTALVVLAYAILWRLARDRFDTAQREIGARLASLVLLGVILVSFDNWLLRPQTLVIPLFALWLWTVEKWRRDEISPAALLAAQAALMLLWVNGHGSFPLALILNGATLLGAWLDARGSGHKVSLRPLLLSSVAAALAILANPRGGQVLAYVRRMLSDPSNRFSAEWLSPTPRNFGDALFFAFALLLFLALAHSKRRPSWSDSARTAIFFWLAITSGRYILWFAMVAALPLASVLASTCEGENPVTKVAASESSQRLNAILASVLWLLLVPLLPWLKPSLGLGAPLGTLLSEETPTRAAQVLERLKPRRLWNNAPSGSYLTWAAPRAKVWIDTRFELYPPRQWRDYASAAAGDARVLEEYRCDVALVDNVAEAPLARALARRGWQRVYGAAQGNKRFSIWQRARPD